MRKILVVIDMQNDFITGSLGTKEATQIVDNVVRKISEYNKEDILITKDTHLDNYLKTNEGKNLPVPHCIKGTHGWELEENIDKALTGCKVFEKSTFGSIELAQYLFEASSKADIEIELIGICTDICVISNALIIKAYLPEVKISVDSYCTAGVTKESHEKALDSMRMCQIVVS